MYYLLRILVWLGLKIYCRSIRINQPDLLQFRGPLILACNHPNAFLDAIILGSLFHQPVHFLARGDAFRNPVIRKFLNALQLIPVYRLTEGKEYLNLNEASFDKCQQILNAGGIVLIFAEGLCLNQWMLRPMKKGTARIALAAMNEEGLSSAVGILPVSLNYNSFSSPGKTVLIHFGEMISKKDLPACPIRSGKNALFQWLAGRKTVCRNAAIRRPSANHSNPDQQSSSAYGLPHLKKIQSRLVSENQTCSCFKN